MKIQKRHSQKLVLGAVTGALMVTVALIAGVVRDNDSESTTPMNCVIAMTDSARAGDVDGYLGCFTGPLQDRLQAQADGSSKPFSAVLQDSVEGLMGMSRRELSYDGPDRARLELERVFTEYNDRQIVELRRVEGEWRIERFDAVERQAPEIRYGTPAFPEQ